VFGLGLEGGDERVLGVDDDMVHLPFVLEPDGEVPRRNLRSKQLGAVYPDQPGTSDAGQSDCTTRVWEESPTASCGLLCRFATHA
jgi:hypothetical protein